MEAAEGEEMKVIRLAVGFDDVCIKGNAFVSQAVNEEVTSFGGDDLASKLHAPDDVIAKSKDSMACCAKVLVPDEFGHILEALYPLALVCAQRMLKKRKEASSKFYKEIPCVVSKSLIAKYQRNKKCRSIKNLVIPICGDKGKQVKSVDGGLRVPALFGKSVIPFISPRPIVGFVRQVEFFRREGTWFMSVCYNTPLLEAMTATGCVGVDRNSVGNVATMADVGTGKVLKLGICPARTKAVMRGRRKNLQSAGKFRLLSKLRLKQSRRMTHENHRASKSVVDYAAKHCRAVAIEKLENVNSPGSKIRRYSEKNNWAFAQLGSFIRYKCALRGVPVIEINPAYTSQDCSRCGSRHKPNGKRFSCGSCGHNDHRDANAAFNISRAGWSGLGLSVPRSGCIGNALAGKDGAK